MQQVRLHIVEFRGFEKFIEGRPYWEVPVMVQRLCGICPVSHHLAASKALDRVVGAMPVTVSADKIRRLMHHGQIVQSHALHFFHLASPDLLFGLGAERDRRNIVGVAEAHPETARQGVLLRKFGQEIIRATAGKRVHGTGSVPGGMNRAVSAEDQAMLRAEVPQMLAWAQDRGGSGAPAARAEPGALRRVRQHARAHDVAGAPRWRLELYDGVLRVRDASGAIIADGVDDQCYRVADRRSRQALDLHEIPLPALAGCRGGLVPRRSVGAACRTATSSPPRSPRRSAAPLSTCTAAAPCTPRWPSTGRA